MNNKRIGSKFMLDLYVALFGMLVIFVFAFESNLFMTALIRSVQGFVIIGLLSFVTRKLIGFIIGLEAEPKTAPADDMNESEQKGRHIDFQTEDSDEAEESGAPFTPLNPPRYQKDNMKKEPSEMAEAVRAMSEQ